MVKRLTHRIHYFFINVRYFLRGIFFPKNTSDNKYIEQFRQNGIIKMPVNGITEELLSKIDKPEYIDKKREDLDIRVINQSESGIKALAVDLSSDFLWKYIFTKEIYEIIHGYYKGGFYLRNNPAIVFNYDGEKHGAQAFHLDWGLRQISIMVSLSDVLPESTHMDYLLGSNKSYWFKHPNRESKKFKNLVESYKTSHPDCSFTTQGTKDSLFIFDAGNGFHRQVPGGRRIMLHLNFVDNLAFTEWEGDWKPAKNSKKEVWFSEQSRKTGQMISESAWPKEVFSLVLQNHKPRIGIPKIFKETI